MSSGRHVDFFHSLTFDQVYQLDRDVSRVLGSIRGWRNSFAPINRLPFEILSLIPTHLSSHGDRLRASFVCRSWRRALLQRGELWSELILSNGEDYTKTFLERAKWCALDVLSHHRNPVATWKLLSSHTEKIRRISFVSERWEEIEEFADTIPGPLPLLHTLVIHNFNDEPLYPDSEAGPHRPLFSGAVNLKVFQFHSQSTWTPLLGRFIFPNLVSFVFEFEEDSSKEMFLTSQLLDFLEASQTLRTVRMEINADKRSEPIPGGRVVVLPNVETFTLSLGDSTRASELGYKIATHISCPSARSSTFVHVGDPAGEIPPGMIFPDAAAWRAITHQYTESPVEKVALEIGPSTMTCALAFLSLNGSTIQLYFQTYRDEIDESNWSPGVPSKSVYQEVFTQATRTIRDHPQVKCIKRLHICHNLKSYGSPRPSHITREVMQLFGSLGPLDELMIYRCDVRPYFCLEASNDDAEEWVKFPPTKELIISEPVVKAFDEQCLKIAELHHGWGKRFERLMIRGPSLSAEMSGSLRKWVGSLEEVAVDEYY